MKINIKSNIKEVAAKVKKLSKKITEDYSKDVRKEINKKLSNLKQELNFFINDYAREDGVRDGVTPQPVAQKVAEEQALGKSRRVNPGDPFYSHADSPVYKASTVHDKSGGTNRAMRVQFNDISSDATYSDYKSMFVDSLMNKTFAIQDETSGKYRYFVLTSELLEKLLEHIKIHCSKYTDLAGASRPDGDDLQDIGRTKGEEKFLRDKEKGSTEWALKNTGIDLIESEGIEVTDSVTATQHGEYQDAYTLIDSIKSPAVQNIKEKALKSTQGEEISKEAEALANTNKAIKNIKVTQSRNDQATKYTIKTTLDNKEFASEEITHAVKRETVIWAKEKASDIKESVERSVKKVINWFNKGSK